MNGSAKTPDDAVAALDALDVDDPEAAHGAADEILLSVAPDIVRMAYQRLVARCPWWASA